MKLHDFLVEHAKFPFPHPDEVRTEQTTDISDIDLGLLEKQWKPRCAVRDDSLIQNLCRVLEDILGDVPLIAADKHNLLLHFSPKLQIGPCSREDRAWASNRSEAESRKLLDKGFFEAARWCLATYDESDFETKLEHSVAGSRSKVDYLVLVDGQPQVLCEAKSPLVMKKAGELLPPRGIKLKWLSGPDLVPRLLSKAALYLGLRKMEWLFLTCHNYWIVCRLARNDDHPYLAYSPMITTEDSSVPFRAFLGAILSTVKGVAVKPSGYSSVVDIKVEEDNGFLPKNNIAHGFGAYPGFSGRRTTTSYPAIRHANENTDSELTVTSSSPNSPQDFQVWVHLYSMPGNTLVLPQCTGSGKGCLWLIRPVGSGSTGNVWECRFDNCSDSFAAKVVELLCLSDADNRHRLRNELNAYLTLEKAYQSGQLRDRITPRCYGAFEGKRMDVLILDLCDGVLDDWGELTAPEQSQVYKLVQGLHRIGMVHGDVEPRNIGRTRGGGFCLIDFSESRMHVCEESKVRGTGPQAASARCPELQILRKYLRKRHPLRVDRTGVGVWEDAPEGMQP